MVIVEIHLLEQSLNCPINSSAQTISIDGKNQFLQMRMKTVIVVLKV
jgi:hypothetical protein